jgi:lipopolysaccharide heptosyltransferase I
VREGFESVVKAAARQVGHAARLPGPQAVSLLKDSAVRQIYLTAVPYGKENLSLVVKIYKDRGLLHRLKYIFRKPKGIAEYLKARQLEERGVPACLAVAGGVRRRLLIPTEHFFLSREIAGARPLRQFFREDFLNLAPEEGLSAKRKFIPALASFVKELHQRGVDHSDFHLGNIMYTRSPRGDFNFFVLDLPAVKVKKTLRLSERLNNLALLNAVFRRFFSRAQAFRFLKLYAQGDGQIASSLKKYAGIIEKKSLRIKSRHRAKRVKRAFSTNRYFRKVKAGRLRGFIRREFYEALSPFIQSPASFFAVDKAKILKAGARATVTEAKFPIDGVVKDIVIKRYNQKKRIDPFKDLFRRSRAFKAWEITNALFYSDLPVALPIGAFEERRLRWLRRSYFLMEKIEAKRLSGFLQGGFCLAGANEAKAQDIEKKRIFLGQLARFIRRLHNQGFANRDLKPTNIFVSQNREPAFSFCIIDYDAYSFKRRVSSRRRLRDLSRLLTKFWKEKCFSRTDRMRFLKEYLADRNMSRAEFKFWCRNTLNQAQKRLARWKPLLSTAAEEKRILIIKPSSIGDCIHSLPVLSELRANFPGAHIAWLVARKALDIVRDNPGLDEVFIFERDRWRKVKDWPGAWMDLLRLLWNIRREHFDAAIDLQGLFRSGLLCWLSGAKVRAGFAEGREMSHIFYTHRITPEKNQHIVEQNLALVRSLGAEPRPPEFKMVIPEKARTRVLKLIEEAEAEGGAILAVLAPGAGWPTKCWAPVNYALLAQALTVQYNARIALVGLAAEMPLTQEIEKQAGFDMINLAGRLGLKELAALLEMADVCVAGDTASLHLAAALGTPAVGIFGPSDPARTGPYGQPRRAVYARVYCSPCFRRQCQRMRCLDAICVEDVLDKITELAGELKWPTF